MSDNLGEYLYNLRGDRSLREIAAMSDGKLSHNYIRSAEKGVGTNGGEFVPSPEKLKAFSEVYNVSYEKLMNMAGYSPTPDYPDWASEEDVVELEKVLDNNVNMSYGGENLTEEEKQRVRDIITSIFWEKIKKKKEGGGDDRTN